MPGLPVSGRVRPWEGHVLADEEITGLVHVLAQSSWETTQREEVGRIKAAQCGERACAGQVAAAEDDAAVAWRRRGRNLKLNCRGRALLAEHHMGPCLLLLRLDYHRTMRWRSLPMDSCTGRESSGCVPSLRHASENSDYSSRISRKKRTTSIIRCKYLQNRWTMSQFRGEWRQEHEPRDGA